MLQLLLLLVHPLFISHSNYNMAQTTSKKQPKPDITGGDDLDDGLELDPDLLASSDNEDEDIPDQDADIGDEETRPEADEDDEQDDDSGAEVGEKRKRDGAEDLNEEERQAEKKRRQKEKFKERKAKVSQNSHPSQLVTIHPAN